MDILASLRQETVVDPLFKKLTDISEKIQQIHQEGINEGVFDTLYDLRCEAYQVAKEIDENRASNAKRKVKDIVDAFFDRLYINLPNDQIEWLDWPLDNECREE